MSVVKEPIIGKDILKSFENLSQSEIFPAQVESALRNLNKIGFPDRNLENWKNTKLSKLYKKTFTDPKTAELKVFPNTKLPNISASTIVIENGILNKHLTCFDQIDGLEISFFSSNSSVIESQINHTASKYEDAFTYLNSYLLNEGIYIKVKENVKITQPIHIVNVVTSPGTVVNSRLNIKLEKFAELKVLQSFIGEDSSSCFVNHVSEAYLSENSILHIDKHQDYNDVINIISEYIHQDSNSSFTINTFSYAGELIRNGLNVNVNGENCHTELNGVFTVNNNDYIDNHTLINHLEPNCQSHENYKGIIKDNGVGVFNGKVIVHKDAQKIYAYQNNNNILLSDYAEIFAKPELEIFADDVKCSHGSTTGQLDDEALFYLQSRGLSLATSQKLLLEGFISEIAEKISHQNFKEYILDKLI
jgi:Fe-S cluster assembly protein SufD